MNYQTDIEGNQIVPVGTKKRPGRLRLYGGTTGVDQSYVELFASSGNYSPYSLIFPDILQAGFVYTDNSGNISYVPIGSQANITPGTESLQIPVWNQTSQIYNPTHKITGAVGSPGSDLKIPTEKAVRDAISALSIGSFARFYKKDFSISTGGIVPVTEHHCGNRPIVQIYEYIDGNFRLITTDIYYDLNGNITWNSNFAITGQIIIVGNII